MSSHSSHDRNLFARICPLCRSLDPIAPGVDRPVAPPASQSDTSLDARWLRTAGHRAIRIDDVHRAHLQEDIGLSVITAGAILAVAQASGGTGRIIFGAIASRWTTPLVTLLMLAILASTAAFLTASLTSSWPLALIYGVGVMFGAGAVGRNGVHLAEAVRRARDGEVSRTTGAIGFVIFERW